MKHLVTGLAAWVMTAGIAHAQAPQAPAASDPLRTRAERTNFAETSHYVQVVYENYQNYRRLYR